MLNKPDPSYHGAVWTQAVKPLGPIAYIIKARVTLLRDVGAAMSPFNAFMFIQGLETVVLRMRQHCSNATAVAQYLSKHPKVIKTIFPGLMTGEPKRRADTYLKGGYGGLVGFELKGGRDAGRKFIDSLQMFYHVANIGDVRSLAIHPASTTHSQLTPEEQAKTGVTDGYVRPVSYTHLAIGKEPFQKRKQAEKRGKQQDAAVAILNIGRMNNRVQQQTLCIYQDCLLYTSRCV